MAALNSRPLRFPGRSCFDSTPNKLGVINLVPHHDKRTDEKLAGYRYLGRLVVTVSSDPLVKPFQAFIPAAGHQPCLSQYKAQQP